MNRERAKLPLGNGFHPGVAVSATHCQRCGEGIGVGDPVFEYVQLVGRTRDMGRVRYVHRLGRKVPCHRRLDGWRRPPAGTRTDGGALPAVGTTASRPRPTDAEMEAAGFTKVVRGAKRR